MLNDIFQNKINIQYNVVMKQPSQSKKSDLSMTYGMHLTRYDYMRVAVAMLNDWNNNTCEGQYLKSLYENRIVKNDKLSIKNMLIQMQLTMQISFIHMLTNKYS